MAHRQFRFQNVEINRGHCLGGGSYAAVYRAMCDGVPCAAKLFHQPLLFSMREYMTSKLGKLVEISSCCQHPNIVQYLGAINDDLPREPDYLMELMDGNLDQYLERSPGRLPYHIQVNICHDISKALNYLHSNGIIHCDVSSRKILLSGDKAKLSISMCSVLPGEEHDRCPGTPCYMPLEGILGEQYTCKLDCFSFGVLAIQIITRQFPDPDPHLHQSEIERRRSHIDLIDPNHPLLPIVLECLKDRDTERPSSQELCCRLAALKASPKYADSVQRGSANKASTGTGKPRTT